MGLRKLTYAIMVSFCLLWASLASGDGFWQRTPDAAGRGETQGEFVLRTPFVPADLEIPQMPGWPMTVTTDALFGENCGLVMADIDQDEDLEIIVATSTGKLHAWDYNGDLIFSVNLTGLGQKVPAVGDVIGDGAPEIIVTTRSGLELDAAPTLHIFSGDGTLLNSGAMTHSGSLGEPPTLANLDGDDKLEILVTERGSSTGWVYALNGDLSPISRAWPLTLDHVPATSAAVGDIDDDGQLEITVCSYNSIYAVELDGTVMSGFPVTFPGETYSYGSPALADLNGDGKLEILTTTHGTYNKIHATQYDGTELTGWPYAFANWSYAPPSVADVDGNGDLEVIVGQSGGPVAGYNLFVINHDGTAFSPFPYLMEGGAEGSYVAADIVGDEKLEIIFTNNMMDEDKGFVFAVDAQANLLDGWPLRPNGFTYLNGATLGDVDGDGVPEIGVLSYKDTTAYVNLYSYDGYGLGEGGVHWRTYQADNRNSGLYRPDYPGVDDDTTDDDIIDDDVVDDDVVDDDAMDDDVVDDDVVDDDLVDDDAADDDFADDDADDDAAGDDDDDGCGC